MNTKKGELWRIDAALHGLAEWVHVGTHVFTMVHKPFTKDCAP